MSTGSTAERSWRRIRNWFAVVVVGFVLTGCASDFGAQTLQPYQPGAGISNRSGQVYTINTLVVTDGHHNGTVVSALINQRYHKDSLTSVTASNDQGAPLTVQPLPQGGIALPPGKSVQLGTSGAVRLSGKRVTPGLFITITFTFQRAAPVRIMVPVVDRGSIYRKVPVGPGS